jgi:hypothetical protein
MRNLTPQEENINDPKIINTEANIPENTNEIVEKIIETPEL